MKKLLLIFLLLALPLAMAAEVLIDSDIQVFKQGEDGDFRIVCQSSVSGGLCSSSATCNVTMFYPNSSVFLDNSAMSNSGSYFNYTITSSLTELTGTYKTIVSCEDGAFRDVISPTFIISETGDEKGLGSEMWKLGLVIIIVVLAILFVWIGTTFNPSMWLVKSALFFAALVVMLIGVGIGINFAASDATSKLMFNSLIVIIVTMLLVIGYMFVYYTISIIKAIKQTKQDKKADDLL